MNNLITGIIKTLEDEIEEYSRPNKLRSFPPIISKCLAVVGIVFYLGIVIIVASTESHYSYLGLGFMMPFFIFSGILFWLDSRVNRS